MKSELKRFERLLSPGSESQGEDEEVVDGEDEKKQRSAREAALKITLHVLMNMDQKELADTLEKSKGSLIVFTIFYVHQRVTQRFLSYSHFLKPRKI